jgi:flagellar basal-body rod protein FlgC
LKVLAAAVPLTFSQQFGALSATGGGVRIASVEAAQVAPRMVYEPGHPYADAQGMVAYPGVDHTTEMMNLNTALRAYEANVVAMNAARTMAARTLDIGGQS